MRQPVNAGTRIEAPTEIVCPHLGLDEDSSTRFPDPSPQHRCYLWNQCDRIDVVHQARFCLADLHTMCPWLSIGAPAGARRESPAAAIGKVAQTVVPWSRRAGTLLAALWAWLVQALVSLASATIAAAKAAWRFLRPAVARLVRVTGSSALRALIWLRDTTVALGARAWTRLRERPAPLDSGASAPLPSIPAALDSGTSVPLSSTDTPAAPVQPLTVAAFQPLPAVESVAESLSVTERIPQASPMVEIAVEAPPALECGASAPLSSPSSPEAPAPAPAPPDSAPQPVQEQEREVAAAADLVERGILALRAGSRDAAYRLFVLATECDPGFEQGWMWRAALAATAGEKQECLEQMLRLNPASGPARSALAILDRPQPAASQSVTRRLAPAGPSAGSTGGTGSPGLHPAHRPPVKQVAGVWKCTGCDTINTGPSRVCRACGHPSPEVEEELLKSGDTLLEQGLQGLKAGNEEVAHTYFEMASEERPHNKLAWHWRAKTAPDLEEVIACLEKLQKLDPDDPRVQSDLSWARQRRKHEEVVPVAVATPPAKPSKVRRAVRGAFDELRWALLQAAGLCAFVLGLALAIPAGLMLSQLPDSLKPPKELLALLPGLNLPAWPVNLPGLPQFDPGPALLLLLGLLLIHAAFSIAGGGGLGSRVWTALLGGAAGVVLIVFGAGAQADWCAAIAAVSALTALTGANSSGRRPYPAQWQS